MMSNSINNSETDVNLVKLRIASETHVEDSMTIINEALNGKFGCKIRFVCTEEVFYQSISDRKKSLESEGKSTDRRFDVELANTDNPFSRLQKDESDEPDYIQIWITSEDLAQESITMMRVVKDRKLQEKFLYICTEESYKEQVAKWIDLFEYYVTKGTMMVELADPNAC